MTKDSRLFVQLEHFIAHEMRMSHVYQPVMLREILRHCPRLPRNPAVCYVYAIPEFIWVMFFNIGVTPMFAVIRHYHFDPKNGAEIDRQVREGFVPLVKKAKGFVSYHWLDTGKGEGASFGVFNDKAGADESVRLAADYVAKNLAKFMTQKPEVIEGPVVAHV